MPWSRRDRPSAALAALTAYVRRERPAWRVQCRSEYVEVSEHIGPSLYDALSDAAYAVGDPLYAALLYPAKMMDVRVHFTRWATAKSLPDPERLYDETLRALQAHVDTLSDGLAQSVDVLGMTTCFGQLFANLAVAKAVKARAPGVKVVLGGSTVSARVGASLLAEYPQVDYVIQGEGEQPLALLLDSLSAGTGGIPGPQDAILSRATAEGGGHTEARMSEVASLDSLPMPDYDEYAAVADRYDIEWSLPLETSRGCWWDRTKRSGNPRATCYFCNLNVQWGGYREKSPGRVVTEMAALSERHRKLSVFFVDNIIRHRGVPELALAIKNLERDFDLFYELRANISPYEFLLMWEAGLRSAQFGVEGLSTAFLNRIGKGTSTIQNLQAMRLCTEFGVQNLANLIVEFPGALQAEVNETARVVVDSALSFEPLQLATFQLGVDSTVDVMRETIGVRNVRNRDLYRHALPEDVLQRIQLMELDFDLTFPGADWSPVERACAAWSRLHGSSAALRLLYRDGGSFLTIEDSRFDEERTGSFDGLAREIYLYCTEIRSVKEVCRRFTDERQVRLALGQFVEQRVMFTEHDRFLSLAVAATPSAAARRIRASLDAEPPPRAHIRLPLAV